MTMRHGARRFGRAMKTDGGGIAKLIRQHNATRQAGLYAGDDTDEPRLDERVDTPVEENTRLRPAA